MTELSKRIIDVLLNIPYGVVLSYKEVAEIAGNPLAARQVSRILHSSSKKYNLPWWRVVNSKYQVVIKDPAYFQEQVSRLRSENITITDDGKITDK